jgi:hypothetical protein
MCRVERSNSEKRADIVDDIKAAQNVGADQWLRLQRLILIRHRSALSDRFRESTYYLPYNDLSTDTALCVLSVRGNGAERMNEAVAGSQPLGLWPLWRPGQKQEDRDTSPSASKVDLCERSNTMGNKGVGAALVAVVSTAQDRLVAYVSQVVWPCPPPRG